MKIYITFGQIHVHSVNGKTFDKDCVAEIECNNHGEGRDLAFEYFGDKFFTSYDAIVLNDPKFLPCYPRGIIKVQDKIK